MFAGSRSGGRCQNGLARLCPEFSVSAQSGFSGDAERLKQWETERQGTLAKAAHRRDEAQTLAQKIESTPCVITAKVGEEGKLFGSVGRQEIVDALAKAVLSLDKHAVLLDNPIKQAGSTTVPVRLSGGLQAQLKVDIVPEAVS